MLQQAFRSFMSSSSDGDHHRSDWNSHDENNSSRNLFVPSWMKEWMKVMNNSKNHSLKSMFEKGQYGTILERIDEFEKAKSFRTEKDNSSRSHDHNGELVELRNDICYLSFMIDKVTCSILNNNPSLRVLNDEGSGKTSSSDALEGYISHLHRVLDALSRKDTLSHHDMVFLIFGLKAYVIGVYNNLVLNHQSPAHEMTIKDIIYSLNNSLQFCLNIVLKKFVRKELKDFDYFDSLQDAIEQNFSGYLFEDQEQLAPRTKKRKKSSSINLPMIDYSKTLLDYLDFADTQLIYPFLNLHVHIFKAFNYLNSLLLEKRKYSKILRTSYISTTNKGVVPTVLKKLTNLCVLNSCTNLEMAILECERTNNIHIVLALIEERKFEEAKFLCNCMTDYIPSLFLLGIIFLEEDNVRTSKEYFLQVTQLAQSQDRHEHTYLIHSCKLISLLCIKEWNLVDGLIWFQKACDLEKTENVQSKVESMYNICKIKEWVGELYSKRKILKDIYQILTKNHSSLSPSEKEHISINPILILYQIGLCVLKEENFQNACQCFEYILTNLLSVSDNEKCWGRLNQNPEKTHPDELVSPLILLRVYIYCLLQTYNFEKALALCDFVLKKLGSDSPDIWPFKLYKCDALMALERPLSECELVLDSVLQGKDNSSLSRIVKSIIYNNKALILICRHQESDAMKLLKKSLALLPEKAFNDDNFKKIMYDLQASITFNITTTCLALNQLEDAAKWWFSFRKIPFSTHVTSEQYSQLFTELEQKQTMKSIKGDVGSTTHIDDLDDSTFMLLSHVTGKCTRQQQIALDLLMLKLYSKHLEKMEDV
nr:unnamed protein product [Naegleria fowleri]